MKKISVLIADDHEVVRQGIHKSLEDTTDISVDGETGDGSEALDMAIHGTFDVVILDISMPGPGGIEIVKELTQRKPDLPILVLSMHPAKQYAVRTIRAGAAGYLTKETLSPEIVTAVRTIASGQRFVTSTVAEQLASAVANGCPDRSALAQLSDREYQVLCMIGAGKTLKEIATELTLSPKTVSTYRARILEKTGLETTADLVRYAVTEGLVS